LKLFNHSYTHIAISGLSFKDRIGSSHSEHSEIFASSFPSSKTTVGMNDD
jgi:hypothetical protein